MISAWVLRDFGEGYSNADDDAGVRQAIDRQLEKMESVRRLTRKLHKRSQLANR